MKAINVRECAHTPVYWLLPCYMLKYDICTMECMLYNILNAGPGPKSRMVKAGHRGEVVQVCFCLLKVIGSRRS